MSQINKYNFSQRQRAKSESRAHDSKVLGNGSVSVVDLKAINGAFSSLEVSQSSIRRRSFIGS